MGKAHIRPKVENIKNKGPLGKVMGCSPIQEIHIKDCNRPKYIGNGIVGLVGYTKYQPQVPNTLDIIF